MVREWASIHHNELVANWERAQVPEQPAPIAPLHEIDLAGLLKAGGVFASIRDDRLVFEAVAVEHEFGTIAWPGDIDLDPDVLRGDHEPATGPALPRRVIQPA